MQLKELLNRNSLIRTERYVNNFKKVSNEVSPMYCAIQGVESFSLPYTRISRKKAAVFLASPNKKIYHKIIEKEIKFFIHPEMIPEVKPRNLFWETIVQPTSSTRTVLPNNEDFFVKLHLNLRLSRYIRRLRRDSVEHSILISQEIESSLPFAPKSFAYLPESIGIVYKDFGMIIREKIVRPIQHEKTVLFPLFSLYSSDIQKPLDKPLFVQLVEKRKEDPLSVFLKEIVVPLFSNMAFFINKYGILLEPHGQNVLVELSKDFEITRLVHRDFQSMYIDAQLRKKNNLHNKFKKHIMGEECKKEITYSLVFDNYVGKYMLDKFVKLLFDHYKIPKNKII